MHWFEKETYHEQNERKKVFYCTLPSWFILCSVCLFLQVQLGILCVTVFGNLQNIPYIAGFTGGTLNVLLVGGTNQPSDPNSPVYMDAYLAQEPGEANVLKPDLLAPYTISSSTVPTGS